MRVRGPVKSGKNRQFCDAGGVIDCRPDSVGCKKQIGVYNKHWRDNGHKSIACKFEL
jgi:hypothetical protein